MNLLRGLVLLVLAASTAWAQFNVPGGKLFGNRKHTHARLVLSHESAKPGDTVITEGSLLIYNDLTD